MSKAVTGLFTDLKESRFWPLALVLVVALVALPVVLSKQAGESAPVPVDPNAVAGAAELEPIAEVGSAGASGERRSVTRLSARNPFAPLETSGSGSASGETAEAGADATGAGAGTGTTGTGTGDTGSTGTGDGSTGSTGDSGTGTVQFYTYVGDVTFGQEGKAKRSKVEQLEALPSKNNPVVVFMGSKADGDEAVFLVGLGAEVTGDGTCEPSDKDCSFLYLNPGDAVSIAVGDSDGSLVTYQLELHKVDAEKVAKAGGDGSGSAVGSRTGGARLTPEQRETARARGFSRLFHKVGF